MCIWQLLIVISNMGPACTFLIGGNQPCHLWMMESASQFPHVTMSSANERTEEEA